MQILNQSRNTIISGDAKAAKSFFSRLRGLMFSSPRDLVLVSPKESVEHSTIHMMFMRFPIDVLWLDSSCRIVDVARKIPPFHPLRPSTWRTYKPCKRARYVVEIGAGDISSAAPGDVVEFRPAL